MNPSYSSSFSSFPLVDLNEDQNPDHLIISPVPHHASISNSTPILLSGSHEEYRSGSDQPKEFLQILKKVEPTPETENMLNKREDQHEDKRQSTSSDDGSMKWMPLKMRVVRKMMNSDSYNKAAARRAADLHNSNDQQSSTNYNGNIDFVRVCSECNTSKTPLWRGGPQGPKSLCNACGIRQRKARKAMSQAAEIGSNRTELDNMEASTTTKMRNNKEKKLRTINNVTQKKHVKLIGDHSTDNVVFHSSTASDEKKLISFDDFAMSFIRKRNLTFREEEDAAIVLMALSCGLIHS